MSTQNETAGIIEFISGHAAALNSANTKSIAEQYAADGILFPNEYPSVSKSKLDLSSGEFFKSNKFKINYEIRDIAVSGDFAFVESSATAVIANLDGTNPVTKVSRDLFTLRKEKGAWKIFRYSFNDSTNKPGKKI